MYLRRMQNKVNKAAVVTTISHYVADVIRQHVDLKGKEIHPVISPIENTKFYCPLTKDSIAWESNDTFNPAATLYNGEIVVLYRAEDKSGVGIGHRTSRLGYATSTDGTHFQREKTPVFYPDNDSQKELEWPGGCEDPRIAVTDDEQR